MLDIFVFTFGKRPLDCGPMSNTPPTSPEHSPSNLSNEDSLEVSLVSTRHLSVEDTLWKSSLAIDGFFNSYEKIPPHFVNYIAPSRRLDRIKNNLFFDIKAFAEITLLSTPPIKKIIPPSIKKAMTRDLAFSWLKNAEQVFLKTEKSSFRKEFRAMLPVKDLGPDKNISLDIGDALLLRAIGLPSLANAIAFRVEEEDAKKENAANPGCHRPTMALILPISGSSLEPRTP